MVQSSKKLETYALFKTEFISEKYLVCIRNINHRMCLSKLRCSNLPLEIEKGRHAGVERELRNCKLCNKHGIIDVEDEYHFIVICPSFENLRK